MGFKRLRGDTRISWRVAEPVWRLYFELQYVHQGDVLRAELRLFRCGRRGTKCRGHTSQYVFWCVQTGRTKYWRQVYSVILYVKRRAREIGGEMVATVAHVALKALKGQGRL